MTANVDESGQLKRGSAPVSAVSVPNHLGYGDSLVHSLDYVVMLHILFATAAGHRLTPPQLWKELKARGIRSAKNANELVGRNAVYESFARLIAAGYLRRVELPNEKHPGRKGPIAYEVYDNPAWNPAWQEQQVGSDPLTTSAKDPGSDGNAPVSMLPGTPEPVKPEAEETAGQNASRNAGTVVQGSGVPGSGTRRVPAGQNASGVPGSVKASPPHPPVGGGGTSPSPQKTGRVSKADRFAAACALDPGDYAPTGNEIKAADAFLRDLPDKWEMSVDEARALAPLLASRVHDQGHELDSLLEIALIQDDPNDPVRVASRVMPTRIRGLKRRRSATRPAAQATDGLAPWCGVCNLGEMPAAVYQRTRELPDGTDVPCPECHPKFTRTRD